MADDTHEQGARISVLEKGQDNLVQEIAGLRADLRTLFADVQKHMVQASRPHWSALLAGVGLVVAILTGLISLGADGPLKDLVRLEQRLDRMDQVLLEAMKDTTLSERVSRLEAFMERTEENR